MAAETSRLHALEVVPNAAADRSWDALVDTAAEAKPMLLSGWQAVLRDGFNVEPVYLQAKRDGDLVGVMALYHSRSWLGGNVLYGMDGTLVAIDDPAAQTLLNAALDWARRRRVQHCQFRGLDCSELLPSARVELKTFTGLRLPDSTNPVWEALSSNTRRKVRKALKEGYRIELQPSIPTAFQPIYFRRQRDLGTPAPGPQLFAAMNAHLADRLSFLALNRDGRLIGGAVMLRAGKSWLNLYVAVENEGQQQYGSYLLYWSQIELAIRRCFQALDFGRSREGSGTHRFKLQWASQDWRRPTTLVPLGVPLPAASLDKSSGWKHALWRQLPLPIARPLGARLRRALPFA